MNEKKKKKMSWAAQRSHVDVVAIDHQTCGGWIFRRISCRCTPPSPLRQGRQRTDADATPYARAHDKRKSSCTVALTSYPTQI
jgi:hypothetical protein